METHYYNNTDLSSFVSLVSKNKFWAEYAEYLSNSDANSGPFLTPSFVDCTNSPIEAFLVGCFLDLPFKVNAEHIYQPDEQRGVTIQAASNLILYKKEIQETNIALKPDLLVIHRYNEVTG